LLRITKTIPDMKGRRGYYASIPYRTLRANAKEAIKNLEKTFGL